MADLHIITIGPRVSWLEGKKVEALLPLATLGFGVAQNREKVSLEVEVLRYSIVCHKLISSHITENQPKTKITVSKVIPIKPTNSPHMVLHTSKICKFLMQLITARWRILCENRIRLSPCNCCRSTVYCRTAQGAATNTSR